MHATYINSIEIMWHVSKSVSVYVDSVGKIDPKLKLIMGKLKFHNLVELAMQFMYASSIC